MSADTFLSKLQGVQGKAGRWRAICPAHESKHKTRTLAVNEGDDGRLLVHCFAGCSIEAIVGAVGMDLADIMPPRDESEPLKKPIKKPWAARDVVAALRAETMIGWVLLTDIANGKVITKGDRERAKLAADRAAHLMLELENAHG